MKMYERSRGYMWRGMSKKEKSQLNGTINRQIAALRPKERGVYVPSIIPLNAGFGFANKPIYRHGRELTRGIYYNRAAVSQVMPFHKYASRTGSVLNGGAVLADKAAAYRWRSQKWGSISANQSLSAEQRALAAARSEKYLNAAIEAETLHQQQMIAQRNAQRARIAQISAARHAARGPIDSAVRNRFAQRYGFKKAAGMTWSNSFSAGRAMGTLSLASMLTGIKKMALSLFSGLAKAIGLLVSPVGLAVTALTALGVAAFMSYKKSKAYKELTAKNAEKNYEIAKKARQKDLKYGDDLYDKYTKGIWGDNKPVIPVSSTPNFGKPKPVIKTEKDKYKDVFDASDMDATNANANWIGTVLSSRQARIGFGNDIYKYLGKNLYSDALNEAYGTGQNELSGMASFGIKLFMPTKYDEIDNQRSADARARTSLIYRGAIAKSTISARNKIIDLYQKYQSKKIDEKTYKSQAQAILNSVANPNANGLLDASTYSASQIAKSDPTKFKLYQQGAYNVIMSEIQGSIGSLSGLLNAQQQLKDGITQYSNKWYSSIAHIINGMDTSVSTIKGNVTVMLRALPNGQIDAENIVAQVRQKVSAFKLTMAQFANLITNVYSELIKSGFVKGKYYSDYIRFTTEQLKGRSVTAEDAGNWFDTYIAKGDAKATWD